MKMVSWNGLNEYRQNLSETVHLRNEWNWFKSTLNKQIVYASFYFSPMHFRDQAHYVWLCWLSKKMSLDQSEFGTELAVHIFFHFLYEKTVCNISLF